jgi:hypothetical protein
MASLIPRCELITIPAGHLVHAARPAEFTAAVAGFLRGSQLPPPILRGPRLSKRPGGEDHGNNQPVRSEQKAGGNAIS